MDDDEDDNLLVKELLREGFPDIKISLDSASYSDGAQKYLYKKQYDICLLDLRLGENDGVKLLNVAKEKCATVPVIFLTGQGDQGKAVEVMKACASDYLIKSRLSVEGLERAIRNAIELRNEKEQRNKAETALRA